MLLSPSAKSLWAKKTNHDGEELWLPLIAHLIDTKNVINYLYNHWLDDGQRAVLAQGIGNDTARQLAEFLGFFHDIGKATPAFQTKHSYNNDNLLDNELIEQLMRCGFNSLDDFHPSQRSKSPHAIAGETILEHLGLNNSVGAIIGGHHGKPAHKYFRFESQINDYTSNYFQSDHNVNLKNDWRKVQQELVKYGCNLTKFASLDDIPDINEPQAVLYEGLLIMADWLASSEFIDKDHSLELFPLISLDKHFDDLNMTERYQRAILNWDQSGHWNAQPINDVQEHYQKRWGFNPRSVQELMSRRIAKITDPGMLIIEAPMGIGKTEIALTAVEQLAFSSGRTGFFMGLPTQATTNAMFNRVNKWLKSIATESRTNLPIKLMHGKAQFNEEMQKLPHAENVGDAGSVVINSWFSGKKSILTDFVIGTIDHLLLMGLKQKHLFLRHLGLSGKVVVIDEIHAYDTYMSSYLKKSLEWLGSYHVPVIALSATLPKEKRKELIESYYRGKYGKKVHDQNVDWENTESYPLLTYMDGKQIKQMDNFKSDGVRNNVAIHRFIGSNDELIQQIVDSIEDGGVAGVVVNTVKRSQEIAKLLPDNVPLIVLHSAFLAPDRADLEKKVQSYIGKNAKRPNKLVVIGTQVLEQSLDIDFDILFTDIAPMDLILQRIGRLHRHKINRPKKLVKPQVYILGIESPRDYGEANEDIYEKYWLIKTDHFLPDTITLPDDISKLVQDVYDSETDQQIEGIQDSKHDEQVVVKKEVQKARAYQIGRPKLKNTSSVVGDNSIHGWLDRSKQGADLSDITAEASVRDIKESIEVILLQHTNHGDYLLDGRNIQDISDKEIAQQLIRLPNAITPNINKSIVSLENITTKYYSNWQDSVWLKGMIALPLDDELQTEFNNYHISYSKSLGLSYERIN